MGCPACIWGCPPDPSQVQLGGVVFRLTNCHWVVGCPAGPCAPPNRFPAKNQGTHPPPPLLCNGPMGLHRTTPPRPHHTWYVRTVPIRGRLGVQGSGQARTFLGRWGPPSAFSVEGRVRPFADFGLIAVSLHLMPPILPKHWADYVMVARNLVYMHRLCPNFPVHPRGWTPARTRYRKSIGFEPAL